MVRVNLINPRLLADQHLIAEYAEILMLAAYVKSHPCPEGIPKKFCLAEGHIRFFKDKLGYLKKRHNQLIKEMKRRGFHPHISLDISGFPQKLKKGWKPSRRDKEIIKKRLVWKLRQKKDFYRYCKEKKPKKFFVCLIKKE